VAFVSKRRTNETGARRGERLYNRSFVPDGTCLVWMSWPSVETLGYCQLRKFDSLIRVIRVIRVIRG